MYASKRIFNKIKDEYKGNALKEKNKENVQKNRIRKNYRKLLEREEESILYKGRNTKTTNVNY